MEKLIRKHGCHINNEKDADSIKVCVLLLDRLIEDKYFENTMEPFYKKWGDPEMIFDELEDGSGHSLNVNYPNVKSAKDEIQERKDFKRFCNREQILKQQDIDLLFDTMKKKIQTWWD